MKNEARVAELRKEIEALKAELKALTGECMLNLKNRNLLKHPYVFRDPKNGEMELWEHTMSMDSLSVLARIMLAPEAKFQRNGKVRVSGKKVRELDSREYKAVCACVDEMAEVLNRYAKELHPAGIAVGKYVEGMELYREVRP